MWVRDGDVSISHPHHDDHRLSPHETSTQKWFFVAALTLFGFLAALTGGLLFGSVDLLSNAVQMLLDSVANLTVFGASYIATQTTPTTPDRSVSPY